MVWGCHSFHSILDTHLQLNSIKHLWVGKKKELSISAKPPPFLLKIIILMMDIPTLSKWNKIVLNCNIRYEMYINYTLDEKPKISTKKSLPKVPFSPLTIEAETTFFIIIFTHKMFTGFYMGHNFSYLFLSSPITHLESIFLCILCLLLFWWKFGNGLIHTS